MTKEEAIADLKSINATGMECIDYAIKALEQQPSDSEIPNNLAKIEQIIKDYDTNCGLEEYMYLEQIKEVLEQE